MNLRNAPVYAIVAEAPGVEARSVSMFVLEEVAPYVEVRTITALVLEAQVPPSLFSSLNGLETLRLAIKKELGVAVTDSLATFGNPVVVSGGYNSAVTLTAAPNSDFMGTVSIQYNRFKLEEAFKGKNTAQVIGAATSVHGRLAAINAFFGLKLEPRDVVDKPLVPDTPGFTLVAATTSYLFKPGTSVTIGTVSGEDLSTLIENDQMDGFSVTTDLEDWIQVTAMNGFEPAT
ncbi:hypothetical protein [Streptomyces sp. CHB9.2]|uniref:DUF7941 domain-family protein n=1 Tax=Streptomyces sp. CHB9.2 TaxID=2841670 RepID=UPI00209483A8|nr:hypothetical protein [Streptomyces sp. CHB9.2]MCO6704719.1 hypothetical protein [Streptomyces sp. CHB9.2]